MRLPAGLDQTWNVTTHGRFTQLDPAQAELAQYAVWTASYTTAVAQTRFAGVTWLLLQSHLGIPTLIFSAVWVVNNSFKLCTLFSKLGNGALTLQLPLLHGYFAIKLVPVSVTEWEIESLQQRTAFVVILGGGGQGDVQTAQSVDFVVINFREDDLLFNAHAVVATTVK